jgi:glycosyltransferase involved in cell wall biosynthesis
MTAVATIVVPLLRQREIWLARAIDSAIGQTVPVTVLVITSPRTPASNLAILDDRRARHGGRLVVTPRTGTGFANAINTGLERAESDRVGLLLSDDWLDPAAAETCLAIDADVVSTGAERHAADGTPMPHLCRALDPVAYARRTTCEERAAYLTHFFLFRRSKVLEVGGLDEAIGDAPGIDDYDLIWTLLEQGATVGLTARPLYHFRIHAGERLTMRDHVTQTKTLERIFDQHGFTGAARARRLEEHIRWFGRPEDVVHAELTGGRVKSADGPAA